MNDGSKRCRHGLRVTIVRETDAQGRVWTIEKHPEDCEACPLVPLAREDGVLDRYIEHEAPTKKPEGG